MGRKRALKQLVDDEETEYKTSGEDSDDDSRSRSKKQQGGGSSGGGSRGGGSRGGGSRGGGRGGSNSLRRGQSDGNLGKGLQSRDSSEEVSNTDTNLDLNFIAMRWLKSPFLRTHGGINLRRLAECYVQHFSLNHTFVSIWGNYFAYGEVKNYDVMKRVELENLATFLHDEYQKLENATGGDTSADVQNEKTAYALAHDQVPGPSRLIQRGNDAAIMEAQLKMQHVQKPKKQCIVYFTAFEASKVTAALAYKLYQCFEDPIEDFPEKLYAHAKHELNGPHREIWKKTLFLPDRLRKRFPESFKEDEGNVKEIVWNLASNTGTAKSRGGKSSLKRQSVADSSGIPNLPGFHWTIEDAEESVAKSRRDVIKATTEVTFARALKSTEDSRDAVIKMFKKENRYPDFVKFETDTFKNLCQFLSKEKTVAQASVTAKAVIDDLMKHFSDKQAASSTSKKPSDAAVEPTPSCSTTKKSTSSAAASSSSKTLKPKEQKPANVVTVVVGRPPAHGAPGTNKAKLSAKPDSTEPEKKQAVDAQKSNENVDEKSSAAVEVHESEASKHQGMAGKEPVAKPSSTLNSTDLKDASSGSEEDNGEEEEDGLESTSKPLAALVDETLDKSDQEDTYYSDMDEKEEKEHQEDDSNSDDYSAVENNYEEESDRSRRHRHGKSKKKKKKSKKHGKSKKRRRQHSPSDKEAKVDAESPAKKHKRKERLSSSEDDMDDKSEKEYASGSSSSY